MDVLGNSTKHVLVWGAAVLSFVSSNLAFARETAEVWQHHIEAWEARDLGRIVSDYGEDSLLLVNGQVFQGLDDIRFVFRRLFEIFSKGQNRIDPAFVDDRIVYITWHFTPSHSSLEHFGTDTFVIENGKILVQTIGSSLYEAIPLGSKEP